MKALKNTTLELIKVFAAYMVVFIHVPFCGILGSAVTALARFAVPLFFLISGFFSYDVPTGKIKKRIQHIIKLLIISTTLYTLFNIAELVLSGSTAEIVEYFGQYLNIKTLVKLVVFNFPISSGHLWYLFAALYVYIFFYFITKFRVKERIIFTFSFCLLFLHILLGEFLSVFGIVLPFLVIRNFALMGIPFFGLGLFAKKHENKLRSISNSLLISAAAIGIFSSLLSRCFLGNNELYIGSLFVLFSLVVTFIKYPDNQYPRCFEVLKGCSTYIYIFHVMVFTVVEQT